jgi:hypothetical protein
VRYCYHSNLLLLEESTSIIEIDLYQRDQLLLKESTSIGAIYLSAPTCAISCIEVVYKVSTLGLILDLLFTGSPQGPAIEARESGNGRIHLDMDDDDIKKRV